MSIALYLIVMAGVTYLVRVIPFTMFRNKIESVFVRSFLYYVPYAVLSAMTFPAVFYSTGNIKTATAGTIVALILGYRKCSLIVVAMAASITSLILSFVM